MLFCFPFQATRITPVILGNPHVIVRRLGVRNCLLEVFLRQLLVGLGLCRSENRQEQGNRKQPNQ